MEENKTLPIKITIESIQKRISIENRKIQLTNDADENTVLQNDDNREMTSSVANDDTTNESKMSVDEIESNDNIDSKDTNMDIEGEDNPDLNKDEQADKVTNVEHVESSNVSTQETLNQEESIVKKDIISSVENEEDKAEASHIEAPNTEEKGEVKSAPNETCEKISKKRSLITVIDENNEKESGYIKCGVCGDVFFSKILGDVRKYGVNSCETCYRFLLKINEYLPKTIVLPLPTRLKCKSTNGLEPCHLPPIRVKVDKKIQTQSHLRCKACWLAKCVSKYELPKEKKDVLIQLLPTHLKPAEYTTPTASTELQVTEIKVEKDEGPNEEPSKGVTEEGIKTSSSSVTRGSLQQRRKTISESLAEYAKRKYTDDTSEQKLIKMKKPREEEIVIKKENESMDETSVEATTTATAAAPITSIAEYMKNKYGISEDHNVTREYDTPIAPQTSTPIPPTPLQDESKQESNNAGRVKRKAAMNFMETMKRVKRNMLHGGYNIYDDDTDPQVKSYTTPKRPKKDDEGNGPRCDICGNVKLYKYIKQAKKFGLYNCEGCRRFILNSVADMPRSIHSTPSYILPCNKEKGVVGKCIIDWELTYRSNKKKCKACHLARGVLRYKMPFQQKQLLVMMLPQPMRPEIIRQALSESNSNTSVVDNDDFDDSKDNSNKKKVVIVKFLPGWTPDLIQRYKDIILRTKELKSKAPKIKIEKTEEITNDNDSDNEQQMLSGFSEEEITQSFSRGV